MRYRSTDSLHDFEFHDAVWTLVSDADNSLVGDVRHLNIHHGTPQNTTDCDMEIGSARITLTHFRVIAYRRVFPEIIDASGLRHPADPPVVYEGETASEALLKEMAGAVTFYSFRADADGQWLMEGCGVSEFFEARITFESACVEWDTYRRLAWYVLQERGIQA